MPSKVSWIALGVGAYLAFALARFPAASAYRWFAPSDLRLSQVNGTIWSGRADRGLIGGLELIDVQWRIGALSLLMGRLTVDFDLRLREGFAQGRVSAGLGGSSIADLNLATTLQNLSSVAPVYGARGQISAQLETLRFENGWPVEAAGEVRIGSLQVPPFGPAGNEALIYVGEFLAQLVDDQDGILEAELRDTGGPLELRGPARLTADRAYEVDARMRLRSEASAMLIQGVDFMASEPDAEGWRSLPLTGSL
jgi:hypothetical protein